MNTIEPYYIGMQNGTLVTVFHVDDRLTKQEQIEAFKKYELPFSCMRINVGYFSNEDLQDHKLSVKTYYNCAGYTIKQMSLPREYLQLPFYQKSFKTTGGFFALDELNKLNNTITFFEVIDPEWQNISSYDMYLLTIEEYAMFIS